MFPFWKEVVAPVIEAAAARRILEIGALRGENTELMLQRLGPDVELHVVDPLPSFDPAEHERRFAGQYIFHEALSLDVLDDLPPMDVALIDGDHNWYTVFNEMRLLADVARRFDAAMPVMILHDVAWPYGRRDLYYDPSNIPAEHRQPWRRAGMRPGQAKLTPMGGGLNAALANALVEGGPRNGVMTGADDFIASYDRPLRLVFLPIYFGLAIVVEQERLDRQPELAQVLDHLESAEGKDMLLRLGEGLRLDAAIFDQTLLRQRDTRITHLADRYLESVKRAILNDHHLETEVRLEHVLATSARGAQPNADVLRDPVRKAADDVQRLRRRNLTGEPDTSANATAAADGAVSGARQGHATTGRAGLDHLQECLDGIWSTGLSGDLATCGVGFGGPAVLLAAYLQAHDPDPRPKHRRTLWVADRFTGTDSHADLNRAREVLARFDLLDERVRWLQGDPAATLDDVTAEQLALVHLGPGLGADAAVVLERLEPRLAVGGLVVVEDLDEPGVRAAVDEHRARRGLTEPLERVGRAGAHWIKVEQEQPTAVAPSTAAPGASRSPSPAAAGATTLDLSVVVVIHDMRREAARSLHALSRRHQQGVEDLDYEVVVVENGSDPAQRLDEAFVTGLGREFRYVDLLEDATRSPVGALNHGIAAARGRALALMVDGAHVVTPRVLHYGMAGLAAYAPAIVATQAWYVGPGQQGEAMRSGYDQSVEDELFTKISWPEDGYRLFDIGHFVGDRDWFDGMWESNCLFVERKQLEQVGGFDEAFAMPGGGYANLDLYERLASEPDVRVVSIIGEGSFHQVHGGTTTNLADPLERRERVRSYAEHYAELRGRPFSGPEKPIHYVGGFHTESARRSRSRRLTASAFAVDRALEGADGPADATPVTVADDLKDSFTNAYYRSLAWQRTRWLGQPVPQAAPDLITYQEVLHDVRPDWVIETGTGRGGRAHFLATICDLLGHGQVLSVDTTEREDRPQHPRITYLTGTAHDAGVVQRITDIVGPDPHSLVILGARGKRDRTRREFEAYAPMVQVGSYVIIEHTVLNGFPVDASFGPGPHEALRRIMNLHGEFLADTEREKHSLTFNAGGFLKKIR